jgi:Acetyltransferase (GNAT) domain
MSKNDKNWIVSRDSPDEDWQELEKKSLPLSAWLEQSSEWYEFERRTSSKQSVSVLFKKQGVPIGGIRFWRGRSAMGSYLTSLGGPIWIAGEEKEVAQQLVRAVKDLGRQSLFVLIHTTPFFLVNLTDYGLRYLLPQGYSFLIDLTKDESELYAGMEKRVRGAIKKAVKNGLDVRAAQGLDDWELFYQLQLEHSKRKGFENIAYDHRSIKSLYDLSLRGKCILQLCFSRQRVLAATLWFMSNKLMVLHRNAWNDPEKLNANNLLFWKSIVWARNNGYLSVDLGGAPVPGPGIDRGIYDFKRSWGGRRVYHHRYYQGRLYGLAFQISKQVPALGVFVRRIGRSVT